MIAMIRNENVTGDLRLNSGSLLANPYVNCYLSYIIMKETQVCLDGGLN